MGRFFKLLFLIAVFVSFSNPPSVQKYLYQKGLKYLMTGNYIGALEIFHFLGNYKNAETLYRETAKFFSPVPVERLKKEPLIRVKILSDFRRLEISCENPKRVWVIPTPLLEKRGKISLRVERWCKISADGVVYFRAPLGVTVNVYNSPRIVVIELPLETYLLGVIPSEVYTSWPLEVLKAQAVASRTFALFNIYRAREAGKLFDVGSDIGYQVFRGFLNVPSNVKKAVEQTRGEVLTYNGGLIYAMFHSNNGGCNHSFEEITGLNLPYLSEVRDNCNWKTLKWSHWEVKLSKERVKKFLQRMGVNSPLKGFRLVRNHCGRGLKMVFETSEGDVVIPFSIFGRLELHLPSDWFFTLGQTGDYYILTGRGFGHGLGMSQWGAFCLAQRGWDYKQILNHYYKGCKIRKVYP